MRATPKNKPSLQLSAKRAKAKRKNKENAYLSVQSNTLFLNEIEERSLETLKGMSTEQVFELGIILGSAKARREYFFVDSHINPEQKDTINILFRKRFDMKQDEGSFLRGFASRPQGECSC